VKKSDSKKWAFFENGPPLAPARELTQRGGTQASAHAATPRRTRIETRREGGKSHGEHAPRKAANEPAKDGTSRGKRRPSAPQEAANGKPGPKH